MKLSILIGIIQIIVAIAAFAYQGISITTREKVVDIGPLHMTAEKTHTLPLPPIVGAVALAGGIVLLVIGRKKTEKIGTAADMARSEGEEGLPRRDFEIQRLTSAYLALHEPVVRRKKQPERRTPMLWTIAIILVILWALGLVSSYTLGGYLHILLVIALVILVVGFLRGRRA